MTARPFDLTGPLPTGLVVLEASAGTGKTYAIAALVARYVAEGRARLQDLLVVTFTRAATGELRDRVRERLVAIAEDLDRVLEGRGAPGDEVTALLAVGDPAEVLTRRDRLRRALADFDAATIATTHGFCEEALASLGIAADADREATFTENVDDLLEEVVDDLYVRKYAGTQTPDFTRGEAGTIAAAAVGNPLAPIVPDPRGAEGIGALRSRLALAVRRELDERKRRLAVVTYDDLLTRLDTTLTASADAVARLRERFSIVLIDEFQDTDPVQWDIIRTAFRHDGGTLVLIGDPKQAVYAFRGADVYAYLRAAGDAGGVGASQTLDTNWRSDAVYVEACDRLLRGSALGHTGIRHRPVKAAPPHHGRRLHGAPQPAPLRIRIVEREDLPQWKGNPTVGAVREQIAADLAGDVVALLAAGATIEQRDAAGGTTGSAPVAPADVAVLVRRNRDLEAVRGALEARGVPAVVTGAGSVFAAEAAQDWRRLLAALERPSGIGPAHSAALTAFLGWSAADVALASEEDWEVVHARLHRWARVLRDRGVAALMETMTLTGRLPERMLARPDGERHLTDLRHLAQLLHEAAGRESLGVTALAQWLKRRVDEAQGDGDEERTRRLESDAAAVQVMTVHRAKGLEFPVVYLPSLWETLWEGPQDRPVAFHDPDNDDRRTLDVGLDGRAYMDHRDQARAEDRGEELRLLYVALTRARHQAIVWWAGTGTSRNSALSRLVFDRAADGTVPAGGSAVPSDGAARAAFAALAPPDVIAVETSRVAGGSHRSGPRTGVALGVAHFGRTLDGAWRRTSFSDLTAGTYEARVASEPEEAALTDEPDGPAIGAAAGGPGAAVDDTPARDPDADLRAAPAALADMPVGTRVGTAIHAILEATDFAAADIDAELAARLDQTPGTDVLGERAPVVAGLRGVLETPLGPLVGGGRLRDVDRADRLDELAFELPLLGGEDPTGRLDLPAVGALLRATLDAGDPLRPYAERLSDPALRQGVRGFLTGSIDLVLRTHLGAEPRFAVVDFKTNWLAPPEEALTAWHHRPAALAREMVHHHYALQALLYSAALHRYLRWRLPGYDPATHLGGVLYLFLRGMTGAGTPTVGGVACGVFSWRPPTALVTGLSDLLDRG